MFVMQTSAMKTCFQIAEYSFSYAKLCNISVTSKYLNEINIIIGLIILKPPSCFLKRMRDFSSIYPPAPHGKRQGSICHDEQVAYRPFPPPSVRVFYVSKMQQASLGNEAYFIGQRSLLHLPTKPIAFFDGVLNEKTHTFSLPLRRDVCGLSIYTVD